MTASKIKKISPKMAQKTVLQKAVKLQKNIFGTISDCLKITSKSSAENIFPELLTVPSTKKYCKNGLILRGLPYFSLALSQKCAIFKSLYMNINTLWRTNYGNV